MKTARALSLLAAVSAFYLLVAGAHVNAYQAALSVPDWPLSYGRILASEWRGNIFYEQHHRAVAAATLVLFIAVLVVLRRTPQLATARRAAWYAGAMLAVQIVMGGLIVLQLNPPWLSALHTLVAIVTVVLIAAVALLVWQQREARATTSDDGKPEHDPDLRRGRRRSRTAIFLVLAQIGLGAVTRHPPAGELVFIATLLAHLVVGVLLMLWVALLGLSLMQHAPEKPLRRWGWLLFGGLVLQLIVGGWVFVISPEPFAQAWPPPPGFPNAHAAHIVLAAFILTCLVAIQLCARRRPSQVLT